MFRRLGLLALLLAVMQSESRSERPFKVGTFAVDASPPIGSPLTFDATRGLSIRSVAGASS